MYVKKYLATCSVFIFIVKEVGIHVGISSMIDRFLFEANTNLALFHDTNIVTSESIIESLPFVLKDQMKFLQLKDITENTYRENFEAVSRLFTISKDRIFLLHEDTVEHRVRKVLKPLFVSIYSHHTTDATDYKLVKRSLELVIKGSTIERLENCLKNLRLDKFLTQPESTQEYSLMVSPNNFKFCCQITSHMK